MQRKYVGAFGLNDVARGEIGSADARRLVVEVLEGGDQESHLDLYHALRVWTWRALDSRRRDDELRDWYDIIRATSSLIARDNIVMGAKLAVLSELLADNIWAAERDKVLPSRHA